MQQKKALNLESDYALAKWLGVTKQAISSYKLGKSVIDDYAAVRIAEVLGVPALEVIAVANMEREKASERREFWRRIAAGGLAAGLIIFLGNQWVGMDLGIEANITSVLIIRNSMRGQSGRTPHWMKRKKTVRAFELARTVFHSLVLFRRPWLQRIRTIRQHGEFPVLGIGGDGKLVALQILPEIVVARGGGTDLGFEQFLLGARFAWNGLRHQNIGHQFLAAEAVRHLDEFPAVLHQAAGELLIQRVVDVLGNGPGTGRQSQ